VIARMARAACVTRCPAEQARAYFGDTIPDKEVRESRVVPEDALNENWSTRLQPAQADRALGLVHTFQKEGRNLSALLPVSIRHMRKSSDCASLRCGFGKLIGDPDSGRRLRKQRRNSAKKDLTRFFNILLQTDDDLRPQA